MRYVIQVHRQIDPSCIAECPLVQTSGTETAIATVTVGGPLLLIVIAGPATS